MGKATGMSAWGRISRQLNTRYHRVAMQIFTVIVLAHWTEHVVQMVQIDLLHWPRPQALGLLGLWLPRLVTSEWLHYGYALVMLAGLAVLRPAFVGRSSRWWDIALGIQVWHHLEHFLLLGQAATGHYLFGAQVPTSVLQFFFPKAELHFVYNALVTIPMIIGAYYHTHPAAHEPRAICTCARHHAEA